MKTPEETAAELAASRAVVEVAAALKQPINPAIVEIAASVFVKLVAAMTNAELKRAEAEGLERASKVTDVVSAEAAAEERNR